MDNSDQDQIIESLRQLSKGRNRSTTAKVREIFSEIEEALKAGVRIKDIHLVLTSNGFEGSIRAFEMALHRVRKEKRTEKPTKSSDQVQQHVKAIVSSTLADEQNNLIQGEEVVNFDSKMRKRLIAKANSYTPQVENNSLIDKLTK